MENNPQQMWDECLRIIADNISPQQFEAWFRPISIKSFEDDKLRLFVPTSYFVEHLEENYSDLLSKTIRRIFGKNVKLFYHYNQVQNDNSSSVDIRSTNPSNAVSKYSSVANPFVEHEKPAPIDSQLNPKYTFENYCASECNRIALSIGKAIGENPDNKTFNPLFIFGPSGCGKTHLMHAIGLCVKEHRPNLNVLYISSRLFQAHFTKAMQDHRINEFIYFYQKIDVLIIDDIQDLIGKDKTQDTFFHIFNHLQLNNKQIILSTDCPPSSLMGLPERLLNRLKWGMTVELGRPDVSLRRQVLQQKSEENGLAIPTEILDYIAENVTDSIRELEGIVVSLMAHAAVLNCDITFDLARSVVSNTVKVNRPQLNFEMILQGVSNYYNIEPDAIFTKSRKREISDARQMVMYMAKKHAKMPFTAIGTRLSRTHATVLYACKNIEERLPFEKQLQDDIASIEKSFI